MRCWFFVRSLLRVKLLSLGLLWAGIATVPAGLRADDEAPITPKETIVLFNGKDLSNFYTYLGDTK